MIFPIEPSTVTVLGYRPRDAADARWAGLHFGSPHVKLRSQSTLMLSCLGPKDAPYDLHLAVPWSHPDDGYDDEDCVYRVRPRASAGRKWLGRKVEAVAIEPDATRFPPWQIRVRFAGNPPLAQAGVTRRAETEGLGERSE